MKEADLKEAQTISDGREGVEVVLENSRSLQKKINDALETAEGDEGTAALLSDLIGATEKRI